MIETMLVIIAVMLAFLVGFEVGNNKKVVKTEEPKKEKVNIIEKINKERKKRDRKKLSEKNEKKVLDDLKKIDDYNGF